MNRSIPPFVAVSLAFVLAACSKPAAAPEPVRAVKSIVIQPASAGARYDYAGEVRSRIESQVMTRWSSS